MRKGQRAGGSSHITNCVHMAKPRTQLAKPTTTLGAIEGIWEVCLVSEIQGVILVMWLALIWSMGRNSTLRLSPHSSKPHCRHSQPSACPMGSLEANSFMCMCMHACMRACVCMCVYVFVCVCHICVGIQGGQKRVSDLLKLGLQAVISYPVWML